jgi:hypothetical protein
VKTYIEEDRIRLVAENDDENQAVLAMINVFAATGYPDDGFANYGLVHDYGCLRGKGLNYCCIPLPPDQRHTPSEQATWKRTCSQRTQMGLVQMR